MARKQNDTESTETLPETLTIQDSTGEVFEVQAGDHKLRLESIPRTTILYLLQNGFTGSITDAKAGINAKAWKDLKDAKRKELREELDIPAGASDEEAAALWAEAKVSARYAKLVAGTMEPSVTRARTSAEEKEIRTFAEGTITEALRANGKTKPKGDDWTALVDSFIEKHRDGMIAEEMAERAKRKAKFAAMMD